MVNDGSDDGEKTEAIARSYGDGIRYFSKENGGVASALNLGIKESEGVYISWLSHDDIFLPQKIEEQVNCLKKEKDRENVLLFSDYEIINGKSEHAGIYNIPLSKPENMLMDLLATWPVHGCTTLIAKTCFDKVGLFDEENKTVQDYDMWFRLLKYGFRFEHMPRVLTRFRVHEKQDSLQKHDSHYEERENTYLSAIKLFKNELNSFFDDELQKTIIGLKDTKRLPKAAMYAYEVSGKKFLLLLKVMIYSKYKSATAFVYKITPEFIKKSLCSITGEL